MSDNRVVLLVDDNPGDIHLTKEAFREVGHQATFLVSESGSDALEMLRRNPPFADLPTPDLILLDLNLPKMDGRQVLRLIKDDPILRRIPTVILTTSNRRSDVEQCYALLANTYIVKPAQWDQFVAIVRSLEHYWFTVASLPTA